MPGDLVVHDATGERGILISTNGYSAVVEWDSTGGKNPADILPVTDLETAPEFHPGTRVSDTGKNITGTVADDPAMAAEYPGMIPVHWDNGDRTVASPSILEPVAAPEADPSSLDAAAAVLRARPELTTNETTVTALIRAAIDAGLLPSALLEARGIVTAGNNL